jgi:hypothetical protein
MNGIGGKYLEAERMKAEFAYKVCRLYFMIIIHYRL